MKNTKLARTTKHFYLVWDKKIRFNVKNKKSHIRSENKLSISMRYLIDKYQ